MCRLGYQFDDWQFWSHVKELDSFVSADLSLVCLLLLTRADIFVSGINFEKVVDLSDLNGSVSTSVPLVKTAGEIEVIVAFWLFVLIN